MWREDNLRYEISLKYNAWDDLLSQGPFGKRFLVTLFKCRGNTYRLKSVVEIRVVVFKH